MNPKNLRAEQAALLTVLEGQLKGCRSTLSSVRRLDAASGGGVDVELRHLEDLVDDLSSLVGELRDGLESGRLP